MVNLLIKDKAPSQIIFHFVVLFLIILLFIIIILLLVLYEIFPYTHKKLQ